MDNRDFDDEIDELEDETPSYEEMPEEEIESENQDFYTQNINNQIRNIRRENKGSQNTVNRLRQRNVNTIVKKTTIPNQDTDEEEQSEQKQNKLDKLNPLKQNGGLSNIGNGLKEKGKEIGTAAKEKAKQAIVSGTKKIAAFLLKNPYVLIIIGVLILIIIIPILWKAYDDDDENSKSSSLGYYDEKCNINNTVVDLTLDDGSYAVQNLSLEDYILGVVYAEIGSNLYLEGKEEYSKAQIVIAKSYALKTGGYNSEKKHITVKSSTYNQAWCDVYAGCKYYKTGSGTYWYYSKASNISKSGAIDYKDALNEVNLAKAKELYKSVEDIFLVENDFSGEINNAADIAQTGFVDYTQNFCEKKALEGKKYGEIIKSLGTDEYLKYAQNQVSTGKSAVSISHANNHIEWFSKIKLYALKEFCQYTPGEGGSCNTRFPLDEGYTVSSGFGKRKSPGGVGSTNHQGVDLAMPGGSPIYAVADGVVVTSEYGNSTGNWAVIGHDLDGDGKYDYYTEYMHQQVLPAVKVGDVVKGGQQIGIVGTTGASTGNHLHFGLKNSKNKRIDPTDTLEKLKSKTSIFDTAKVCQNSSNTSSEETNFNTNNNGSSSNGSANTCSNGVTYDKQPDPAIAINYWNEKGKINKNDFIYPKDSSTNYSLGAHPKNFKYSNLRNMKNYSSMFAWPATPTDGIYKYVYEHNGIDILANMGTPIYSPVNGTLVYSEWGHTLNKGCDETAYSVKIKLDTPFQYNGKNINYIFLTHMVGIVSYCPAKNCSKKVAQGDLLGFIGNASGSATDTGSWASHLHMTFCGDSYCNKSNSLTTSEIEKVYNITANTTRKAGE